MLMFLTEIFLCRNLSVIYIFFFQMIRCFASHQCKFHLNSMYGGLDASYTSNNVKIDKEGFPEV